MRVQSHHAGGRLVNHTSFGRQLRQAAKRALVPYLERYEFGFQDGGCAMFAHALVLWSCEQLSMAGYAPPGRAIQHVVAVDGDLILDSDGVATVAEGTRKMAILEQCPGCVLREDFHPQIAPRIPWNARTSHEIAEFLTSQLPDPVGRPWRQAA